MRLALAAVVAAAALAFGAPAMARPAVFAGALADAKKAMTHGPAEVRLGEQATLALPKGYRFVPGPQALEILKAMGNQLDTAPMGLVIPESDTFRWLVVAQFMDAGYIKDDDARNWNADELLTSIKESAEADNAALKEHGFPELVIDGWVEKPSYDAKANRLVWSISDHDVGEPADAPHGINYNTFALGREGYLSLNLVTNSKRLEADRPVAKQLLGALTFLPGKRYADFDSQTDKVAAYGLTALVAGVAAKKLGLLAILVALAVKFFKVIAVAAVAGFFGLRKVFTGRGAPEAATEATATVAAAPEAPAGSETEETTAS